MAADACVRAANEVRVPPVQKTEYERDLATAHAALSGERFASAWATGQALRFEQLPEAARELAAVLAQAQSSRAESDPLSSREREVARLIAAGKTNREIAAELIISERTVDGHAANILSKLGLRSRAQVAVWAVEHQLVSGRT